MDPENNSLEEGSSEELDDVKKHVLNHDYSHHHFNTSHNNLHLQDPNLSKPPST